MGFVLILIGFIMVVLGIILGLFKLILKWIMGAINLIAYIFFSIYDIKNVHAKLGKAEWTKEELDMIEQIENSGKRQQLKESTRKEVYEGILLFSARMKAKYPLADRALFSKMENEFLQKTSLTSFKKYEKTIRESHEKNSKMDVYQ